MSDFDIGIGVKESLILGSILVVSAAMCVFGAFNGDQMMTIIGMVFAYGFGRVYGNGKMTELVGQLTMLNDKMEAKK